MLKLTGKGSFISKSQAGMLQAVAVLLMVWHHLFAFPERIAVPSVLVLDRFYSVETFLAYFGRICVAVFAFVSGYGMRKKIVSAKQGQGIIKNYRTVLLQLLNFFCRYWMVLFVFVPIGLGMKVYSLKPVEFLKSLVGLNTGYNGEWWYVSFYMGFLLLFPILTFLFDVVKKHVSWLLHLLVAGTVVALFLFTQKIPHYQFLSVLMCFVLGMYFVDSPIFEWLEKCFCKVALLKIPVGLLGIGAVFALRLKGLPDYILVAPFVFSVVLILKTKLVTKCLGPLLKFVGKYSTYIWLTHTFFGYYLFQNITFAPKYSWLVFLWCMLLSLGTGMVLEKLRILIGKLFKR